VRRQAFHPADLVDEVGGDRGVGGQRGLRDRIDGGDVDAVGPHPRRFEVDVGHPPRSPAVGRDPEAHAPRRESRAWRPPGLARDASADEGSMDLRQSERPLGRVELWLERSLAEALSAAGSGATPRDAPRAPRSSRGDGGGSERRILHVDMDAFFANAERLRHPELAARPVVVGGRGDPTQRGVVSSASYEARRHGVRSGMPLRTAWRRCPEAVFLPVDFAHYRELSERFKAALRELAESVEDAGIDEAFADLSQVEGASEALARAIKARIREQTGLSCSIGIAPNKLLAKIASDLEKPDGLTILGAGDLEARVWPLPTRALPGVGPRTEAKLRDLGASRVGELARLPLDALTDAFGPARGAHLHRAARGIDESPLVPHWEPRSIGREITFEEDVDDPRAVASALRELVRDATARLRRDGLAGRVVGVKLRFADFETHSHAETLAAATEDPAALRKAAFRCLRRFSLGKKVRLVGVRIAGLEHAEALASEAGTPARLLVTARGFGTVRDAVRALREAVPAVRVRGAGFAGILFAEAIGDALALAERVARAAAGRIGRVVAVLAEVESARRPIEEAAVALGRRHIGPEESFCFRLHKRGAHALAEPSPVLEREIGGAIWTALRDRDGRDPRVDLASPDVTLAAEVLGPHTVLCLQRRAWHAAGASPERLTP
jgi:DNA polymerase-4